MFRVEKCQQKAEITSVGKLVIQDTHKISTSFSVFPTLVIGSLPPSFLGFPCHNPCCPVHTSWPNPVAHVPGVGPGLKPNLGEPTIV